MIILSMVMMEEALDNRAGDRFGFIFELCLDSRGLALDRIIVHQ